VIKKTFDAETDILGKTRAAGAGALSATHRPPHPGSGPIIEEGGRYDVGEETYANPRIGSHEEEIDASEALKYWTTKGITNEGPRSYREAMRDDAANLSTSGSTRRSAASNPARTDNDLLTVTASSSTASHQQGSPGPQLPIISTPDNITGGADIRLGSEEAKPPSPPDIVRTANTDSDMSMEQDLVEEYDHGHQSEEEDHDQEGEHDDHEHWGEQDDYEYRGEQDHHEYQDENDDYKHQSDQDDHKHQEHPGDNEHDLPRGHQQDEQDDYHPLNNLRKSEGRSQAEIPVSRNTIKDDSQSNEESNICQPIAAHAESTNDAEVEPLKSDLGGMPVKPRHVRSSSASSAGVGGGVPYRAYARRSRLRSPRGMAAISPDHLTEIDGTQSVVSVGTAHSALSQGTSVSQVSTLSSRAARFSKDRKDKRKPALTGGGGGAGVAGSSASSAPGVSNSRSDVFAKDKAQNILWGRASKERIKQRADLSGVAEQNKGDSNLKTDSPFDEPGKGRSMGRPQTIDLKPAMPRTGDRISGLNIDVGRQRQFQPMDHTQPSKQMHEKISSAPEQYQTPALESIPPSRQKYQSGYPKKGTVRAYFDHATSMDEISYSALQGKDLFDISKKQGSDVKIQPTSVRSLDSVTLESNTDEFTPLPRGAGKSFDSGCQVFEAINPLLESAFNALSPGSHASSSNIFSNSGRVMANTFCNDAPSDEDVAIEVEYVERDEVSRAETDSLYSASTRDLDSYV